MAQAIDTSSGQLPATRTLHDSFTRAEEFAARRKHAVVGLDHLLLALLDDANARSIMFACQVDIEAMRADLLKKLGPEARGFTHDAIPPGFDITVQNIVSHASMAARQSGKNVVDGTNILAAIISGEGGIISHNLLQRYGLTFEDAINVMNSYEGESAPVRPRLASDRSSDRTLETPHERKSDFRSSDEEYRAPQERRYKGEEASKQDQSPQEPQSPNNFSAGHNEHQPARPAQSHQYVRDDESPSDRRYAPPQQERIPFQQTTDDVFNEETEELFDSRQADLFEQFSQQTEDPVYEVQELYEPSNYQSPQSEQRPVADRSVADGSVAEETVAERKQNPYKPNFQREDQDSRRAGDHSAEYHETDNASRSRPNSRSDEPQAYEQQYDGGALNRAAEQLSDQSKSYQDPQFNEIETSHHQPQPPVSSRRSETSDGLAGTRTTQGTRQGHPRQDHPRQDHPRDGSDRAGEQRPPTYSGYDHYAPNQAAHQPPPPPQTGEQLEDDQGSARGAYAPPFTTTTGQVPEEYRQTPPIPDRSVASPQISQPARQGYAQPPAIAGIPYQTAQMPPQSPPQTPVTPEPMATKPELKVTGAATEQALLPAPYNPSSQGPIQANQASQQSQVPNLPSAPADYAYQALNDPGQQRSLQPQLTSGDLAHGETFSGEMVPGERVPGERVPGEMVTGEMAPTGLPPMSREQYSESRQETGERMHDLAQSIQQNRQGLQSRDQAEGQIIENIPATMRSGALEFIEVRVARYSDMEIEMGMQNYGLKSIRQEGKITKALTVRLSDAEGHFMIEPLTSQTQWIEHQSNLVDNADFAIWRWKVMPLKSGPAKLRLDVCLRSFKDDGLSGEIPLQPTQNFEIKVKRNYGKGILRLMIWSLFFALGATAMLFQENLLQIFENLMTAL